MTEEAKPNFSVISLLLDMPFRALIFAEKYLVSQVLLDHFLIYSEAVKMSRFHHKLQRLKTFASQVTTCFPSGNTKSKSNLLPLLARLDV